LTTGSRPHVARSRPFARGYFCGWQPEQLVTFLDPSRTIDRGRPHWRAGRVTARFPGKLLSSYLSRSEKRSLAPTTGTWTLILKIRRRKSGVSPMADASQSFHFFRRLSSYKSPARMMFMRLLGLPTMATSVSTSPSTHSQHQCGGGPHAGGSRLDIHLEC
jgi:hypothetical protein